MLVKKLSATERNITILFYFAVITTIVSAVPAVLVWQEPTQYELGLLVLVGVSARRWGRPSACAPTAPARRPRWCRSTTRG